MCQVAPSQGAPTADIRHTTVSRARTSGSRSPSMRLRNTGVPAGKVVFFPRISTSIGCNSTRLRRNEIMARATALARRAQLAQLVRVQVRVRVWVSRLLGHTAHTITCKPEAAWLSRGACLRCNDSCAIHGMPAPGDLQHHQSQLLVGFLPGHLELWRQRVYAVGQHVLGALCCTRNGEWGVAAAQSILRTFKPMESIHC